MTWIPANRVRNFIGGKVAGASLQQVDGSRQPGHDRAGRRRPPGRGGRAAKGIPLLEIHPGGRPGIQYLFRFKRLLEENFEDLARTTTIENGKDAGRIPGELRRGIENVEVACGIPALMQGYNLENVAAGIDEIMIRQPLGVVAAITPFNFPAMIPLWFLPYAIACGNCFILKPSERTPLTPLKLFGIIEQL